MTLSSTSSSSSTATTSIPTNAYKYFTIDFVKETFNTPDYVIVVDWKKSADNMINMLNKLNYPQGLSFFRIDDDFFKQHDLKLYRNLLGLAHEIRGDEKEKNILIEKFYNVIQNYAKRVYGNPFAEMDVIVGIFSRAFASNKQSS